jgi:hypothetical protein
VSCALHSAPMRSPVRCIVDGVSAHRSVQQILIVSKGLAAQALVWTSGDVNLHGHGLPTLLQSDQMGSQACRFGTVIGHGSFAAAIAYEWFREVKQIDHGRVRIGFKYCARDSALAHV